MAAPGRFSIVAPLPPFGGFRRALAVEHAGAPRPVVIAFPPPAVADDPERLSGLLRAVDAAVRLHHPGAATVLGTETIDGALAIVEEHRAGLPVRALLDAAGRLPPDVAVRVVLDAAAALTRAHAIDAGAGVHLAHGALDPARILVAGGGEAFVSGLGLEPDSAPEADVRALGAVLHECLAGEAPGTPPRRLDTPGIPEALAAAVDRAVGADGPSFAAAGAFADAVAAAVAPADHASVAAYADAVVPADEGERGAVAATLAAALGRREEERVPEEPPPPVAAGAGPGTSAPAPLDPLLAEPPARPAPPDAAGTFPRPALGRARSRVPLIVGAVALAAGFAIGFVAARSRGAPAARESAGLVAPLSPAPLPASRGEGGSARTP